MINDPLRTEVINVSQHNVEFRGRRYFKRAFKPCLPGLHRLSFWRCGVKGVGKNGLSRSKGSGRNRRQLENHSWLQSGVSKKASEKEKKFLKKVKKKKKKEQEFRKAGNRSPKPPNVGLRKPDFIHSGSLGRVSAFE